MFKYRHSKSLGSAQECKTFWNLLIYAFSPYFGIYWFMPSLHIQLGHGVSLRVARRRPSELIHVHARVLQSILNAFCIFQNTGIAKRRLPEAASGPVLGPFCLRCGFHYIKKKARGGHSGLSVSQGNFSSRIYNICIYVIYLLAHFYTLTQWKSSV